MSFRLPHPLPRSRSSSSFHACLIMCVAGCAVMGAAGCGGGGSRDSSFSGIVVSYPATLTREVTLADLTPVGSGVTVAAWEQFDLGSNRPRYYKSHAFPVTDASGHFNIRLDKDAGQANIYVPGYCANLLETQYANGGPAYVSDPQEGASPVTHTPGDQLTNAALLARGHFGTDQVIVTVDRADACYTAGFTPR